MSIQMLFYLLFPFFLVTFKTKRRAWITLAISFILQLSYDNFFVAEFTISNINIVRQWVFFAIGGVLYHYSDYFLKVKLNKAKALITVACLILMFAGFYFYWYFQTIVCAISFSAWIILQLIETEPISKLKPVRYCGKIGFELYLFNLAVISILNKLNFVDFLFNNISSNWAVVFCTTYFVVLCLTFCMSSIIFFVYNKVVNTIKAKF